MEARAENETYFLRTGDRARYEDEHYTVQMIHAGYLPTPPEANRLIVKLERGGQRIRARLGDLIPQFPTYSKKQVQELPFIADILETPVGQGVLHAETFEDGRFYHVITRDLSHRIANIEHRINEDPKALGTYWQVRQAAARSHGTQWGTHIRDLLADKPDVLELHNLHQLYAAELRAGLVTVPAEETSLLLKYDPNLLLLPSSPELVCI